MSLTNITDRSIEHFLRWMRSEGIEFSKNYQPLDMQELVNRYEQIVENEKKWLSTESFGFEFRTKTPVESAN